MGDTVLGLDLGSNSIGWALVDEPANRIIATGVRVFPEGVARTNSGGEIPRNQQRREARGQRRQIMRRARRKKRLRRILANAGLLPDDPSDLFGAADPYHLRRRALTDKLSPHEMGRLIYHLNQRRGFLSNRKVDRAADTEVKGMLAEISGLEKAIADTGCRTLGEYLASIHDHAPLQRVRGRHTRRDMYQAEFDLVWAAQRKHHPKLLTDALREKIHCAIFYQRPLRIPKHQIGTCELIANRRRCPKADRRAQRFRLLCELNNLRYVDEDGALQPVAGELRDKLLAYLEQAKDRTFDQIRKHLDWPDARKFNFEFAGKRTKLWGMPTDAMLANAKLFGKAWRDRDEEEKNAIVRALLEREEPEVLKLATSEWGLSPEAADRLLDVNLPAGYMSYCREAIARLLPHLEQGLPLSSDGDSPCAITAAGFLRPWDKDGERLERLPEPPELPNPIVRQALFEVRKVVNSIVREFGRPDRIHIELAREVRGSAKQREEQTRRLRAREQEREKAADEVRQAGFKPNRDTINLYLLWQEQGRECPYSGDPISVAQLFGGDVDVDHILPRQRSLDNSLANKVVVFNYANREKGQRTGYEWLGEADPERFEQICGRLRKADYRKMLKFRRKNVELDDFVDRQLRDTAYISRAAKQYLQCLVEHPHDVLCIKGQLTAELRHQWGLSRVLDSDLFPADMRLGEKNRGDHRHHAVDAVTIALTDRSRLQALAREDILPDPWAGFREDVKSTVNAVNVSHRVRRKVAGPLHEETAYGPTEKEGVYVVRKPVEALSPSEVEHIRDPVVRQKVVERLAMFGIEPGRKKGKIPGDAWAEPLWMNAEKSIPIRRVRICKPEQSIIPLRGGQTHVKPGSTHHLCIFELPDGKRAAHFVTMLEAARRARAGKPIIQRTHPEHPEAEFVMSLSAGEMVLLRVDGGEKLHRFETAASTSHQMWFRHHTFAGKSADKTGQVSKQPNTLQAFKVTVDPLGRIRWAND